MYPGVSTSGRAAIAVVFYALSGFSVGQYSDRCETPLGQNGSCVWLNLCKTYMMAFLMLRRDVLSADIIKFQHGYKCETNDLSYKVCCPFQEGYDPDSVYRELPPDVSDHGNLRLLPVECGRVVYQTRTYGGMKTGLLEFPWMALISTDEGKNRSFTCAGTIISERYILTAAHCITNLGDKVLAGVRVGEHDYSKERDCSKQSDYCNPPVQDFYIEKVIPHPSFIGSKPGEKPQLHYDIGLLRLQGVIDFSRENSQPVCLPTTKKLQQMRLDWETAALPGWGLTNKDENGNLLAKGDRLSADLLKIYVPTVTNKRCGQIYNRSITGGVGFRHICAGGEQGKSSCNGDSGGPLLVLVPEEISLSRYLQIGVISGGALRCGRKNAPAIANRVAYYMDWILHQLEP